MNQSKKIEISKSTFISLKAELLRKQDEVNKAKLESKNQIENFVPASNVGKSRDKSKHQKQTVTDQPRDAEEAEALRKSKASLERKSKLYDHLSQGSSHDGMEEHFLVQFQKKETAESSSKSSTTVNPDESEEADLTKDDDIDSDGEWADYVDCLGRTRRCLKTDLEYVQSRDDKLKKSLQPNVDEEDLPTKTFMKEGESPPRELVPPDAYKEMLRQQWEQKERELMDKDTVHYEDVLFNESRSHGVSYYALSGDATLRSRQQAELAKTRAETEVARAAAAEAREKREAALKMRVKAAQARRRARAGLPPEEDIEEPPSVTAMLLDFVEEQKKASSEKSAEETRKQREEKEKIAQKAREKFIREWDVGKDADAGSERHRELTQEEWVDKKRTERQKEFAPFPQTSAKDSDKTSRTFDDKGFFFDTEGDRSYENKRQPTWQDVRPVDKSKPATFSSAAQLEESNRSLFFTTKKTTRGHYDPSVNTASGSNFEPVPILNECSDESDDDKGTNLKGEMSSSSDGGRKRAEIEPPSTYDYYGPVEKKRRAKGGNKTQVSEAFEQGMQFLQQQADSKDNKKKKPILEDFE